MSDSNWTLIDSTTDPIITKIVDELKILQKCIPTHTEQFKTIINQQAKIIDQQGATIDNLVKMMEEQSKMINEIKILRFDQSSMIQSMVTEGKQIQTYQNYPKSEVSSLICLQPNNFAFQRDLNWKIRSGKSFAFTPEHTIKPKD